MRVCRFVLFFLAALIIASCIRIDEVDINSFNQPDGEVLNGTVAVFGNVTTEMRQHRVTISPVHQWGDNQNVLPEINRVFVLCGNDTIPYIEKEADRNKMVFVSEQPFKGEAGKRHHRRGLSDAFGQHGLLPNHPGPHKSEELSDAIGHDGA